MRLELQRTATACLSIMSAWALGAAAAAPALAAKGDNVFTIAKYPVSATADNAVAAKELAIADGQQAAFKSLLRRLLPVTAYPQMKRLASVRAADLVASMAVRSEGKPTSRYIATLDFAFNAESIRDLLRRNSIAFVDQQGADVVVVPVYVAPPAAGAPVPADLAAASAAPLWREVWQGLDLANSLQPVKLAQPKSTLHADTIGMVQRAEAGGMRILTQEYGAERVLLAIAEPAPAEGRLHVTLAGRDGVGAFALKRSYRMARDDFAYTAELAAVVALGTLEGRWKSVHAPGPSSGTASGPPTAVQLVVQFRSLGEWEDIQRTVRELPGVAGVQIGGRIGRSVDMAVVFPGGGPGLQAALAPRGLKLTEQGGIWLLQGGS